MIYHVIAAAEEIRREQRRERPVHKKLSRLVEPNLQPYFFCLALFIAAAIPVQPMLAAAEAARKGVFLHSRNVM